MRSGRTTSRDGLGVVHAALGRGIDVRGFFHWTGVDNYEWLLGYGTRFGLFDRDRVQRPSATVLATEALGTSAGSAKAAPRKGTDQRS